MAWFIAAHEQDQICCGDEELDWGRFGHSGCLCFQFLASGKPASWVRWRRGSQWFGRFALVVQRCCALLDTDCDPPGAAHDVAPNLYHLALRAEYTGPTECYRRSHGGGGLGCVLLGVRSGPG